MLLLNEVYCNWLARSGKFRNPVQSEMRSSSDKLSMQIFDYSNRLTSSISQPQCSVP